MKNQIDAIIASLIKDIQTVSDRYEEALKVSQEIISEVKANPELQEVYRDNPDLPPSERIAARDAECGRRVAIVKDIIESRGVYYEKYDTGVYPSGKDTFSTLVGQVMFPFYDKSLVWDGEVKEPVVVKEFLYRIVRKIAKQNGLKA